jgi:signal transduction histidine kinase
MLSRVNTELKNYVSLSEKNAEDRERKRISREIHDTLGHALTGISAGIDACLVLIDIDQDKAKQQLQIVSSVVREGINDVRRSLNKLRPGALENQTLKDAVAKMIHEFEAVSHVDVHLYYGWDRVDLDHTKEDVVFRVIQEAMTNAVRHGKATLIDVEMYANETEYTIIIQDNGSGCEHIEYGYGLTQMKERLAMIGASVQFMNLNGFRVIVEIPVRKGEENL